ncbi:MAG TPA: hypothetical protein VJX73_16980 [Terracidiphilus sp.]|nr:hypothetical protein [Terracidiphilus sp.]
MRHVDEKDLSAYLAGVTERGRALYAYDQAAWHGTDAFFALHPDRSGLAHYICMKTPTGWEVAFPKWNETHDRLLVAYEAKQAGGPEEYTAVKLDPPREGPDDLVAKERALELAVGNFGKFNRPYNTAILPAEDGDLYVYLYPGQTKSDAWPLGGDVRYTISADGKQILERRQLHKAILDFKFDPKLRIQGGVHSHVLSDVPEDTDVLYVLTRRPSIPEYIGTAKHVFAISIDGSIQVVKK